MDSIRQLTAEEARHHRSDLARILLDCVEGGASVNFMAGFTHGEAEAFFDNVIDGLERQDRILLVAFEGPKAVGTVQILLATPPNQPHRADVAKLLVHRSARGRGVATSLMHHVEEAARLVGRTLLVLDTVTGGTAESLYARLGWTKVGSIPNYALFPDGTRCSTTIFWKGISKMR